jgi:hypothetical protein
MRLRAIQTHAVVVVAFGIKTEGAVERGVEEK